MNPGTRLWMDKAVGHLGDAGILLEGSFYAECMFFCQQAIEVLLKVLWVERESLGMPPKIHGLVELDECLGLQSA